MVHTRPTTGFSKDAKNLDNLHVGEEMNETMGLRGVSVLWTLGSPYRCGTLPTELRR